MSAERRRVTELGRPDRRRWYDTAPDAVSVPFVARLFKVNVRTVRRWIRHRNIPAYRIGGLVRIRRDHIQQAQQAIRDAESDPELRRNLYGFRLLANIIKRVQYLP